jgi:CRP/FNR family transcriptional regulator, cyclic AMP receptor protein
MMRRSLAGDGAEELARIPLFAELTTGERRMLGRLVDELVAGPGETLMRQGEPGYEVLAIEQGTAEVIQDGQVINTMGPGDFFGELAVLEAGPRTASVIASSQLRAIVFTAHFLHELRERMPSVGARIDSVATERIEHDARAREGT